MTPLALADQAIPEAAPRVALGRNADTRFGTDGRDRLTVFSTRADGALLLQFGSGAGCANIHVPADAARAFARAILAYADLVDPPATLAEAA